LVKSVSLFAFVVVIGCESAGPETHPTQFEKLQSIEAAGIHNAFQVSNDLYSGSSPEGDAGFASLRALGVQTIISVDGAKPDVETARRHGMTYIHLPFGYDGIPRDRMLELIKASDFAAGPIYVHCHHGKHRGPVAVAVIQLCTDPTWDAAIAETWLHTAGTDPRYKGLMQLPRTLHRPTAAELAEIPTTFPSVAVVPDLAKLMVETDECWEHLKLARDSGWTAPKSHPDIDPPHEALLLVEHFRAASQVEGVRRRGPEFAKSLSDADVAASELERVLRERPVNVEDTRKAFTRTASLCASCHDKFRDRPADR
jgi:protein tyrosine phosphatase (PTP) superfamily phosphohydrolase (DUF442 family)